MPRPAERGWHPVSRSPWEEVQRAPGSQDLEGADEEV